MYKPPTSSPRPTVQASVNEVPRGACVIDGCGRRTHARGWCEAHYCRWRRTGHPLGTMRPGALAERFWAKVRKGPGCWEWTGSLKNGYGRFRFNGRMAYAHRVSWALAHGDVPGSECVCHHCDNPLCVRPGHLFLGNHRDNMADMRAKGRGPMGERVGTAKLSRRDVVEILTTPRTFGSGVELARKFGVTESAICAIRNGRRWTHVRAITNKAAS